MPSFDELKKMAVEKRDWNRDIAASQRRSDRVWQGCEGKQAYPSKEHARRAAKGGGRKYKTELHDYHCEFCGRWHIGKPAKRGGGK